MSANLRSSEKARSSTCELADRVASLAVDTYRAAVAPIDRASTTVLAAFVAVDGAGELELISWGCGTQFCDAARVAADARGDVVRDCHAEVLARRALRLAMWRELELCARGEPSRYVALRARAGQRAARWRDDAPRLVLYTSSQPCGNATLKRWAKARAEKFRDDLGRGGMPLEPHEPMHLSARCEGQAALLVKGGSQSQAHVSSCGREGVVPPGCSPASRTARGTMTCSDKIARWTALGVQGALLSRFVGLVPLAGVVVGRKFSFEHARRALCCRVDARVSKKRPSAARVLSHPALMGTSVPLDDPGATLDCATGARFDDDRNKTAFCWALGDEEAERLDGRTGRPLPHAANDARVGHCDNAARDASVVDAQTASNVSRVARRSLFKRAAVLDAALVSSAAPPELRDDTAPDAWYSLPYGSAKARAESPAYAAARAALLDADCAPFADWCRDDPATRRWSLDREKHRTAQEDTNHSSPACEIGEDSTLLSS